MKRKLNLEEIHSITLNLMDRVHDICEKNKIKYVLGYGTLIGAVRHKGFIPWDDDFDIWLLREDYNRFVEIVTKDPDNRYKLVTRGNTENYHYGVARYCDTKYEYHTDLNVKQYQQGIFIDVYVLDSCGDTEEETDAVHRQVMKLNAQYMVYCNRNSLTSKARTLIRIPYHYYLHIKYGKHFGQKIDKMMEELIYSAFKKDSKYVGIYWENKDFRLIKRSWYEHILLWPFEDREYWILAEYDECLRLHYGDYMTPPPENERVASHDYSVYEVEGTQD